MGNKCCCTDDGDREFIVHFALPDHKLVKSKDPQRIVITKEQLDGLSSMDDLRKYINVIVDVLTERYHMNFNSRYHRDRLTSLDAIRRFRGCIDVRFSVVDETPFFADRRGNATNGDATSETSKPSATTTACD